MSAYRTRNQGLAALWRYLNGRGTHLRTYLEESRGATFELADPNNKGREISQMYHADDGGNGFAITDAKSLIDEFVEVRRTLTAAIDNAGEWRNTN